MKTFCFICFLAVLSCVLVGGLFLGIGTVLNLFLPITAFQTALLLMAPFCCLLILFPLLLINQKIEEIVIMMEEDYMLWDEDEWMDNRDKSEKKRSRSKQRQNKIIVMGSSPIDRNAPCPCGSGKKYKNCCGQKGKSSKNEGE
jgi:hypothetical protein